MLDDAPKFLLRAGKKTGNIFECNQRNVERIAKTHETRALYRSIDVQGTGEKRRLICDHPNGSSIQPRKSHYDVLREVLMYLEEVMVVHHCVDDILDVIGLQRVFRNNRIQ